MTEPRITVIIPTRERCDVLQKSLQTVTSQDYENLQIIVSDNFSGDDTERLVRSVDDKRVRYVNTGQRISMSRNWEFALSHVSEGWVTIIGDDGLLPASLRRVAQIIQTAHVKAIRSSVCSYSWPALTGKAFGQLGIPLKSGYEVRDSKTWLSKVLDGRVHYAELPMLYNGGYVDVTVLNMIKRRTGAIYRSCIPDIYSAISISSVVDRYAYSNEPLAINGASRHSTGTAHFASTRVSELSPAAVFASEENIPLHEDIPRCSDGSYPTSLHALVYESYLQSKDLRDEMPEDNHPRQLKVILGSQGGRDASVIEWGRVLAAQHDLDFERIRSKANRAELLRWLCSMWSRIAAGLNTYYAGSLELPIRDVYEASVAAAAIRKSRPSRLRIVQRWLRRLTE